MSLALIPRPLPILALFACAATTVPSSIPQCWHGISRQAFSRAGLRMYWNLARVIRKRPILLNQVQPFDSVLA